MPAIDSRQAEEDITEREDTILLADFATVWNELFPAEQARIVQLLVERVDVQEDALVVRIRAEGLVSLVGELRGRTRGGRHDAERRDKDGRHTLVVRIPMRFQRRGGPEADRRTGRQRARAGLEAAAGRHAGQGAARAWRWQRMLESGEYGTLAELAAAERISRSYVCRVLLLTLVAPDIVERITDGRPTGGARAVPAAVSGRVAAPAGEIRCDRRLTRQGSRRGLSMHR